MPHCFPNSQSPSVWHKFGFVWVVVDSCSMLMEVLIFAGVLGATAVDPNVAVVVVLVHVLVLAVR